jgi:hypothetical protein
MARSRNSRKLHVAAITEISIAGHRMPLTDTGDTQPNGMPPNSTKGNTTKPRLLSTAKTWPPLSQSLRPARPPEEGERGTVEQRATLKEEVSRERGWGFLFLTS